MNHSYPPNHSKQQTHFGFETIPENTKKDRVAMVFSNVAKRYDLMNDLMSVGLHRAWKHFAIDELDVHPGHKILDIAAGTADMTLRIAQKIGSSNAESMLWHTDINTSMLKEGKKRLINKGILVPSLQCDSEQMPFPNESFDRAILAFGLRNMTHKETALTEIYRILKPQGRLVVLEFSKINNCLQKPYDWYSFNTLPKIGKFILNDEKSYRYLAESIQMHPDQETLKHMFQSSGFTKCYYKNLTAGIVAIHTGIKTKEL
jgi:demethylmenaquinone methyltransferase/2-methoxy-6-polyprenyl-1,4-benzoquinol methylase